jgi:hemolysin activation/secretion protein
VQHDLQGAGVNIFTRVSEYRRHTSVLRTGYLLLCGACFFLGIAAQSVHANTDSGLQGNPVDSLPKVDVQAPPTVTINVEKPQVDPAMQQLLTSYVVPANFQISGVKALPFDDIAAVFTPMINRVTTVAQLLEAANQVTKMYQDRGYPLSVAFIPAQRFENNIVVITVVEGYVSKVKIEGNPGGSEERLRKIAEQLLEDKPLRRATFERVAGILNLQPGVSIVANVAPPTTTDGAAEMTLVVKRRAFTVGLGMNYLQPGVRGLLSASSNGLFSLGEQVTVSTLQPRGKQKETYYAVNYIQPLGRDGLLAKLNWSDYRAKPENNTLAAQYIDPHYKTRASRIAASLSYPLALANTHSLMLSGGVYSAENDQTYTVMPQYGGAEIEIHSVVRVLHAELSWVNVSMNQAQLQRTRNITIGLYQGIEQLGSKNDGNNVDLGFTKVTLQAAQSAQLPLGFGVAVSSSLQYSQHILPNAEQIGFGGKLFGLGYASGELAGDKGWGISAEINRLFNTGYTYLKTVQPYLLADHSRVYSNAAPLTRNTLGSVALGVRMAGGSHYALDISIAKPVADLPVNSTSRSPRLNMMYSYQLD